LSKIHAGNRLSGPLGSGNRSLAAALELVALHFGANFLRLSKSNGLVKQISKIICFALPHRPFMQRQLDYSQPYASTKARLQRQTLKDRTSQPLLSKPGLMPA